MTPFEPLQLFFVDKTYYPTCQTLNCNFALRTISIALIAHDPTLNDKFYLYFN